MSIATTRTAAGVDTQSERERAVRGAVHSGEMEGIRVSEDLERDASEYASGAIDLEEFGRRVLARK
jgi:hypothetical protein